MELSRVLLKPGQALPAAQNRTPGSTAIMHMCSTISLCAGQTTKWRPTTTREERVSKDLIQEQGRSKDLHWEQGGESN